MLLGLLLLLDSVTAVMHCVVVGRRPPIVAGFTVLLGAILGLFSWSAWLLLLLPLLPSPVVVRSRIFLSSPNRPSLHTITRDDDIAVAAVSAVDVVVVTARLAQARRPLFLLMRLTQSTPIEDEESRCRQPLLALVWGELVPKDTLKLLGKRRGCSFMMMSSRMRKQARAKDDATINERSLCSKRERSLFERLRASHRRSYAEINLSCSVPRMSHQCCNTAQRFAFT